MREPGQGGRDYLRRAHQEAQIAEINAPDENGAFPGTWLGLLLGEPIIIVPDTNVLRQDIDSACRRNSRGVLITCANSGTFRIICAEHVINEVERHLEEWAHHQQKSVEAYVDRWNAEYLPLLHVVRGEGLPLSVLSPAERARIDVLNERREDLASIVLALSLGAFYLTKDARAWEAVYGRPADRDELYGWLAALQDGGDAGELGSLVHGSTSLTVLAITGIGYLIRQLWRKAPWAIVAIGGAAMLSAIRTRRERYQAIGAAIHRGVSVLSEEIYGPYYELSRGFQQRAPQIPLWTELERVNSLDDVLTRACAYYLGRAKTTQMTAKQLATELRYRITIGRDAQRIRETFRQHPGCFYQPNKGEWQLGQALTPLQRV